MNYWYCIRKSCDGTYYAQWKSCCSDCWHTYGECDQWEAAYDVLCEHATPAALAVRFVGTF